MLTVGAMDLPSFFDIVDICNSLLPLNKSVSWYGLPDTTHEPRRFKSVAASFAEHWKDSAIPNANKVLRARVRFGKEVLTICKLNIGVDKS